MHLCPRTMKYLIHHNTESFLWHSVLDSHELYLCERTLRCLIYHNTKNVLRYFVLDSQKIFSWNFFQCYCPNICSIEDKSIKELFSYIVIFSYLRSKYFSLPLYTVSNEFGGIVYQHLGCHYTCIHLKLQISTLIKFT